MIAAAIEQERLARAERHYEACFLCEHRCGVNRRAAALGSCKAGCEARVFRHRIELGEEIELIPSHLFYLSGCDLRCCFCIAEANAFNPTIGTPLSGSFLARAVAWGRTQGARNIQWVGGEPTIHLPAILQAMAHCRDLPPVVWKSDFYGTQAAFELLAGVADIYVADFKFGNDECAKRIAKIDRYVDVVSRNLSIAAAQGDLIVRHLLLPGHFECCFRAIVEYIGRQLPDVKFSVRAGYRPRWQAMNYAELAQPLEHQIAGAAVELALGKGLNVVD